MTEITTPKGLVGALTDLSFSEFVTTRLITFVYVLAVGLQGLFAAVVILSGLRSGLVGLLTLVVAPLLFVVGVLYTRVVLEFVVVVFRIADHTKVLADDVRSSSAPAAPAPSATVPTDQAPGGSKPPALP